MLWCRTCGFELSFDQLHLGLEDHRHFDPDRFQWNITMECASCLAGRPIGPQSSRNHERALYYLVTYGFIRIRFEQKYHPSWLSYLEIHERTSGDSETARGIAGKAIQKIPRLWVASHKQGEGYMLSHLKTTADPCMPSSCPIDGAEIHVKYEARQQEKTQGLVPSPHPTLLAH
jgi:hypothetical protein